MAFNPKDVDWERQCCKSGMDCDSYVGIRMASFDWAHGLIGGLSVSNCRFVVAVDFNWKLWWWTARVGFAVTEKEADGGEDAEQFGSMRSETAR
jgi:hypothetical protein